MESISLLALVLAVTVTPASLECINGNCTESDPVFRLDLQSIFPFFSPAGISTHLGDSDQTIDSEQPVVNASQDTPQDQVFSINFVEIFAVRDDEAENEQEQPALDKIPEALNFLFPWNNNIFNNFGILDLSGKTLTGEELAFKLRSSQLMGRPVTSLILSNSRIENLTADSFLPVEDTLQELRMDNTSVNLDALTRLTNLKLLNLSHTGLSVYQWYPQLRDTLQILDLSHNLLQEVRPEISVLTSLRELNLSYNRITSVEEFPLAMLPNLEIISLTMNSLNDVNLASLEYLQVAELDWNYLWRFGEEVRLPAHRVTLKLASNPWRCDCGMLDARDNYDVLDIDKLKCNTHSSYEICDDCKRRFLPTEGQLVSNLTKESIEHLGCTGFLDQIYLLHKGLVQLRDHEPEKLMRLEFLFLFCIFLGFAAAFLCRRTCTKKKFNRQSWLKVQQIPYLKIDELEKPEKVAYIKIEPPQAKA